MSYALLAVAANIVCWRLGDWKHWDRYYPTILYAYLGNLVYDLISYKKPLWACGELVCSYPVLDLAIMALIYPAVVILYLAYYPKTVFKQAAYILLWTGILAAAEFLAYSTGGFTYYNGWTFWYSVAFNLIMFPLLRLHHKRPLLVWPISAALAFAVIWWFRIPLAK